MFIYMCAGCFYIAALRTFLGITWETSVMVTGKKKTLEAANPARFSMCGSCYSELPLSVFLFTFPFPPLQQSSEAFIDPCYTLTPKLQQSKSFKKKKKGKMRVPSTS